MSSNILPNLVDHAKASDPHGIIGDIANLLAQSNEMLKDIIFQKANTSLAHRVSANVGLPQGTWRQGNQGVGASKPEFANYTFNVAELTAYSMVDKSIATLNDDVDKFRWTQDQSHVQGLSQQVATAMLYSNEAVNPNQFSGFFRYFSTVNQATAQSATHVIDAGGTGSNNASIMLAGHGDQASFGIYPAGSQAGLIYEDKGDIVPLYDSSGNRFEGYTSYFCWKIGLALFNYLYNARICNIDTTTAGIFGPNPPDLFALMDQAALLLPTAPRRFSGITEVDNPTDPSPGVNPVFYCNRTIRHALNLQAIRDKNVLLKPTEYAGQPVEEFRGIPLKTMDVMLNSESRVV